MAFNNDYDLRFGATNPPSTSFYKEWIQCFIHQVIGQPSVFTANIDATDLSSVPVSAGNYFGAYYNNSATPSFIGVVQKVAYVSPCNMEISGMDFAYFLRYYPGLGYDSTKTDVKFYTTIDTSLTTLVQRICSVNGDASAPWIIEVGSVDDLQITAGKKLPLGSRLEQFYSLQRIFQERYFFVSEVDGKAYVTSARGSATSVKDYYLTGINTNAYLAKRIFDGNNVINDITVVGANAQRRARYYDATPVETTLAVGDVPLTDWFVLTKSGVSFTCSSTMYVANTDGWDNSGYILLNGGNVQVSNQIKVDGTTEIAYTGKTANSFTGCTVSYTPTANVERMVWGVENYAYHSRKIFVESTSGFPDSGAIVIGEEIMPYSSKTSTTFNLSAYPGCRRCLYLYTHSHASTTQSRTATTINLDSGALGDFSSFPQSGLFEIIGMGTEWWWEIIKYAGKGATSFTGCQRPYDSHDVPPSSLLIFPFFQTPHPKGVLVKKLVTSGSCGADASYDTGSSLCTYGNRAKVIYENHLISPLEIEKYASQIIRNCRWGDQYHVLYPTNIGDFDPLELGDKITITDSRLSLSGLEARVMELNLTLDRTSGYVFSLTSMPYSYAFTALPKEWETDVTASINQVRELALRKGGVKI